MKVTQCRRKKCIIKFTIIIVRLKCDEFDRLLVDTGIAIGWAEYTLFDAIVLEIIRAS